MNNISLANNVPLAQNDHFVGANNGNNNENQNNNEDDPNQVSDNDEGSKESYDGFDYGNVPKNDNENNYYLKDEEDDDNNIAEPEDDDQDTNDINQPEEDTGRARRRNRRSVHQSLPGINGREELNGSHLSVVNSPICLILGAMVVADQAGVRMTKEYFKIEASKSTPQYRFRKGLQLFSEEGYQAAKDKLETNLLGRGCIAMLSWKDLTWDI